MLTIVVSVWGRLVVPLVTAVGTEAVVLDFSFNCTYSKINIKYKRNEEYHRVGRLCPRYIIQCLRAEKF